MNRRTFLGSLATSPWLAYGISAHAQHPVAKIGLLERSGPSGFRWVEGFREGLRELGYIEGKNVLIETRRTLGHEAELRPLVAELIQMNPDLIVTVSTPAARAVLESTKTIPVVFLAAGDPVGTGLVPSLARPEAMPRACRCSRPSWAPNAWISCASLLLVRSGSQPLQT